MPAQPAGPEHHSVIRNEGKEGWNADDLWTIQSKF